MLKKMTLLALSVGALAAFAVPAVASAQLKEGGTNLAVGAEVTATSTNLETVATALKTTLICELATLHLEVVQNEVGNITLSDAGTTIFGCGFFATNITFGTVTMSAETGVAAGATFVANGICDFSGNIPFSYELGGSTLIVIAPGPQFNGNCGPIDMMSSFILETSDGTKVTVD